VILGEKEALIVAEMSCNHCQDFGKALDIVKAAKWAGADAVKVQMFTPDLALKGDTKKLKGGLWDGMTLHELYSIACMPYEWIPTLRDVAEKLGLLFFTSVYDPETVDIAEENGNPVYKISSFEIGHEALLKRVARTKKPIILSTGQADFKDIYAAKRIIRSEGNKNLYFLHCVSNYPAKPEDMNLMTLMDLGRYCNGRTGISDHSRGIVVPTVAASLGVRIIEKHIKVDNSGLDARFSLTPEAFRDMVLAVRTAEKVMGKVSYGGERVINHTKVNGRMVRTLSDYESLDAGPNT